MKKILFILLSCLSVYAQAQTAEEIIGKYTTAMGGLENFNNVKTLKMTGTVSIQGMDLPLTVQVINGRAMRTDVSVMGQSVTNAYKDGKGWTVNPFAGITVPTEVTGSQLNDLKMQATVATQLMDYKARGHKVESKGQEDIEGIKCFKIDLTAKDDGKVTTYYISTSDYLPIKSVTTQSIQGEDMQVENFFSDAKTFEGIKFFMTRDQKIEGETFQLIKYEKVELNAAIDEKVFDIPKQ